MVGAEALVRWVKPDGMLIPPVAFIPVMERVDSNLLMKYNRTYCIE